MFKQVLQPRSCAKCGKAFLPRVAKRLYCSKDCYWKSLIGRKHPYLPPFERICVVCGTPFTTPRTGGYRKQRMCSMDCQRAARYRNSEGEPRIMSDTEAAYLAGILDGEGSVMLQHRGEAIGMGLGICNTDQSLFSWIMQTVQCGSVCKRRAETEKHKVCAFWRVSGAIAEKVLRQIRPYLVIKAERADLAVAFQERLRTPALKADRTWQREWMQKMKKMNKRGPITIE